MSLKNKLQEDRMQYWKAGQLFEKNTLSLILSGIQTAEKSGKAATEFTDEQTTKFLLTEIKKRKTTAKTYEDANVLDRAEKETAEAEFLATYLPQQLTEEEVTQIVTTELQNLTPPINPNKLIGIVMGKTKGKTDGELVKKIVTTLTQ